MAHCRQCVKVRRDEMNGKDDMKPAGADEEEKKNSTVNNKVKARPWLHTIRSKDAGATSILVVSSMPKIKAELDSKGNPSLFAP